MLRRILTLVALGALLSPPAGRAQVREWEEDYSDEWPDGGDYGSPDDYDVSVDLGVSGTVTLDTFEESLSPHGEWVEVGSYGRVWRPRVAAGWRPYYYGRWEWTNEGWLWVSDEPWGWAAYHYGRWTYDDYYGWVWIPGYQWAPAWVAWRYSGDVVGWAPLGPGVSVYVSSYPFAAAWWTFVPCTRFVAVPVYTVAFAPSHTRRHFFATAPAPPRGGARPAPGRPVPAPAWGGPPRRSIEQRIGRPVAPVRVVRAPSPGAARVRPGEVSIYRPEARPSQRRERGAMRTPGASGFSERSLRGTSPDREWSGRERRSSPAIPGQRAMPGPASPRRSDDDRQAPRMWGPGAPPSSRDRGDRSYPVLRGGRVERGPSPAVPRVDRAPAPAAPRVERGGGGGGRGGGAVAPARPAPPRAASPGGGHSGGGRPGGGHPGGGRPGGGGARPAPSAGGGGR
jgi:uncharacterized membrane protein YgcG